MIMLIGENINYLIGIGENILFFHLRKKKEEKKCKLIFSSRLFCIYPTPPLRTEYDTRSIFKRSAAGLKSKFSFS